MISKWETINKKHIQNLKIFDVSILRRRHPEWNREGDFVVLNSPRWVNIIPITKDGNVVLIEQYRHGIDDLTLEVPGGLVEPNEEPMEAAERECREETGFSSEIHATLLGEILPNPAFLDNKCYSYVWLDCELKYSQHLDGSEEISVIEYPLSDIKNLILNNKIQHSLVLTAFFFYFLKYNNV